MKKHISTVILIIILLAGLSLLLYPTVSDLWNSYHQTRVISDYKETVTKLDTESYEEILEKARAYNEELWHKSNRYYFDSEEEKAEYESLLNINGDGMMGYVEVPSISCSLPVYHGVDEEILQRAVGHIVGSSLPVGGEGTHCVLSAHRGLPSAKLFTNLDEVREGDVFILRVLNEVLTYEVDQIRIVLPEEVQELELVEGQDYCTLVTCTPYGINSHRLLVRGHRVANRDIVAEDASQIKPISVALLIAVPIVAVMVFHKLWRQRRRRKVRKVKEHFGNK